MISKIVIVGLLSVLVLSSVSMAMSGQPVNTTGEAMGSYSFNLVGNSTIKDLAYSNEETSSMLANNISVNGVNYANLNGNLNQRVVSTSNMTVVSLEQMNALIVSTSTGATGRASITVNLTTQPVAIENKMKIDFQSQVGSILSSNLNIMSTTGFTVYEISNGSFMGYLFTNGHSTLSNNNMTVTSVQTSTLFSGKLVAGFVSNGDFKGMIKNYFHMHRNQEKFSYNNTTGLLSGKFVNLTLNNKTGVITNFTSRIGNNTVVFTNISAAGNGTIGASSHVPPFRTGEPLEYGSIFFYANNSYVYVFHDNPAIASNFFLSNGTMAFNVSSNLKISEHNMTYGSDAAVNISAAFENSNMAANVTFGLNDSFMTSIKTITIAGNGYFGMMSVNGGKVSISGSTVTVKTSNLAKISMVSPPGLQMINASLENRLQNSIAMGRIAGMATVSSDNGSSSNMTIFYNNSLKMGVTSVQSGKVTLEVGSDMHTGTTIAIYVSDKFVSNSGKIYVTFDGKSATLSSFNGTINATSTTSAYYTTIHESSGTVVLIHVPHFSNHTIEVSSTPSVSSPSSMLSLLDYEIAGGIGAVIIFGVVIGFVLKRRH